MDSCDYAGASKQAISKHYDRGRSFYELWLDESLTYSCALWGGASSLAEAQSRKLDFHIGQARVAGKPRMLDVGCGWGSLLMRAVKSHDVHHAVGLTLSSDQAEYISSWNQPRVEARLENWINHNPEEPYDGVICIGALEHFARADLTHAQKTEGYRSFFSNCHQWLRTGGRVSVQTITYGTLQVLDPFISERIWPESDLPRLAQIVAAVDGLFEIDSLTNHRDDYAKTCESWASNILDNRDALVDRAGSEVVDDYSRYLRMSTRAFRLGALCLYRMTLTRIDR